MDAAVLSPQSEIDGSLPVGELGLLNKGHLLPAIYVCEINNPNASLSIAQDRFVLQGLGNSRIKIFKPDFCFVLKHGVGLSRIYCLHAVDHAAANDGY
ncbi:hypothetical protein CDAR_373891 [Caerostris darwini]|uniref:Uncharacterized protein n=1 Tax=Caerostris darwini TaxID=1538125 RepID=A0AAV4VFY0_9ARAC|nr:hypothetical protein CDAR_373891 [Caerostris darwini]